MKTKTFRIFICALAVSISATFSSSMITDGFTLTLSGIILPLLLYLNWDVISLELCPVIAFMSPFLRWALMYESGKGYYNFQLIVPDVMFYLTYAVVFYIIYNIYFMRKHSMKPLIIGAIFSDLFANLMELSFRVSVTGITYSTFQKLLLIAVVRGLILLVIVFIINYYSSFLNRQDHETKYRKLMLLAASFKSEIYFMHKNMDRIETVMNRSFSAYKMVKDSGENVILQEKLLDVSKDVHEIKKDYVRIIKAVEAMYPELLQFSNLTVNEVVKMLALNTKEQLISEGNRVFFTYHVESSTIVKLHYFFMSMIANLVQNAIEAGEDKNMNYISLNVVEQKDQLFIKVKDTGEGIDPEHLANIYKPGFSTKFDEETGDINRGVGLSLVKGLVEEHFLGTMEVKSKVNEGTKFFIKIPLSVLKGDL